MASPRRRERSSITTARACLNSVARDYPDAMAATPRPLYFWHIPKTAGMSFTKWLSEHYAPETVFEPHLLPDLRAAASAHELSHQLFCGHFAAELPDYLPRRPVTLTVLREPRARTISHLNHIWRAPDHYLHDRLRHLGHDLRAVLRDPVLRLAVSDVQARYLALDPQRTVNAALPLPVPVALQGQARFEFARLPPRATLASRAVATLFFRLSGYGLTESLHGFANQVANRFGWPAPKAIPTENTNPSGVWSLRGLSTEECRLVDEVNPADLLIYRIARSGRRLKPIRPHLAVSRRVG